MPKINKYLIQKIDIMYKIKRNHRLYVLHAYIYIYIYLNIKKIYIYLKKKTEACPDGGIKLNTFSFSKVSILKNILINYYY